MEKKQSQVAISTKEELKELNEEFGRKGVKFEVVRYELLKRACRRQERTNLNFKSKSLGWSSILDCVFGKFCKELRLEEQTVLMRLGWREFIKTL